MPAAGSTHWQVSDTLAAASSWKVTPQTYLVPTSNLTQPDVGRLSRITAKMLFLEAPEKVKKKFDNDFFSLFFFIN